MQHSVVSVRDRLVRPVSLRLTLGGRVVGSLNKIPAPFRWMGSTVAVYDCTVREKADGRGESSSPARRGNRRGRRSGARSTGKRRRLVPAAPLRSRISYRQDDSRYADLVEQRRGYLSSRKVALVERIAKQVVKLEQLVKERDLKRLDGRYVQDSGPTVLAARDKVEQLVELVSRLSGSPPVLARARSYLIIETFGGKRRYIKSKDLPLGISAAEVIEEFESFKHPLPVVPRGPRATRLGGKATGSTSLPGRRRH